jgi:hypothetical protein
MPDLRRSRKLQLFLSDGNPLWKLLDSVDRSDMEAKGLPPRRLARWKVLDIAPETLSQWRRGEVDASPERVGLALQKLRHRLGDELPHADLCRRVAADLLKRIDCFEKSFRDGEDDIYAVGQALIMSREQVQKAIDTEIHGQTPLLRLAYFDSDRQAAAALGHHAGRYQAWLRQPPHWLQGTLEVRYVVPVHGAHIVRTKLNVPNPSAMAPGGGGHGRPVFEYDGFVRELSEMLFWTFENRDGQQQDFLHIVTNKRPAVEDGERLLNGRFLTVDQCGGTRAAHGMLVLRAITPRSPLEAGEVRVLTPGDPGWDFVEHLARRFEPPGEPDQSKK